MMIKFRSDPNSGEWTIYDHCKNVVFESTWQEVPAPGENGEFLGGPINDMFSVAGWGELALREEPIEGRVKGTRLVRWVRWMGPHPETGQACMMLLVSDMEPMFLMSDEGKTLERI